MAKYEIEIVVSNKSKLQEILNPTPVITCEKFKYNEGDILYLQNVSLDGSKQYVKEYKVIKIIYTVNNVPINCIIAKQLSGPREAVFTLSKYDCHLLQINYEEDLQVLSQSLDWLNKKDKFYRDTDKEYNTRWIRNCYNSMLNTKINY